MDRGWYSYIRSGDEKPQKVTRELLKRIFNYARPYRREIGGMLATILLTSTLALVSPLIFREMIDNVLPAKDIDRLILLALGLLLVPLLTGAINVAQRRFNSTVGEGVIYDSRTS